MAASLVILMLGVLLNPPRAVAAGGDPEVEALIRILKDGTKSTAEKGDACLKLMEMPARAKPAVPALIPLLQARDQDMRDFAITTLKAIGPAASAALPALKKVAASDPVPEIRSLAEDAIGVVAGTAAPDDVEEEPGGEDVRPAPPAPRPAPRPPAQRPPTPRAAPHPAPRPAPRIPAAPAPGGRVSYDLSVMASVFPELTRMPAPAWVKTGMQFTFYSASAIIAGEGPVFQLDPNGNIYANDGSGRRYSMKPGGRITNDLMDAGHSGHGYAECTIVGVSTNSVAVAADIYSISGAISAPRLASRAAFVGAPGSTGDLWVSPVWLAKIKPGKNMMFRVNRLSYDNEGKRHAAVAFASNDGSMVFIYDVATGILLYRGGSGEGEKSVNMIYNGAIMRNTPSRMLTLSKLVGRRVPGLPWAGQASPDWVNRVRAIRYSGEVGLVVTGSPNIPLPMTINLQVKARGNGWVRFHLAQSAGGVGGALPTQTNYDWMAGPGQLGGLWIAPEALANLRPGQALDRNPDTEFVTKVENVARTPDGSEMLVISRNGRGQTTLYGYDRKTGILSYFEQQDRGIAGSMVARVFLQGWE